MDHTLTQAGVIAQVMGPLLIVVSLSLLSNPNILKTISKDIAGHVGYVFLISLVRFFMGMIVISMHNVRYGTIEILITILGWVLIIGGTFGMMFPDVAKQLIGKTYKNKNAIYTFLLLALIAGIILSIHGWVIHI